MSLWTMISDWISRDATKYLYQPIAAERVVGAKYDPTPLTAGGAYFRLWLGEMFLKKDQAWFNQWHPAVHSLVRIDMGSEPVEVPYVAGPLSLKGVTLTNLNQVVQLNYPITPLLPFNGGVVEVMAGLLAMKGGSLISPVLKVLEGFAGLLNVPQLSAALTVAVPIASGLQEILTATNSGMHLGFHQTFTGKGGGGANELKPGYIAVMLTAAADDLAKRLWVVNDRLYQGESQANVVPLTGYDYMLFRIEGQPERDWEALDSIKEPRDKMLEALSGVPPDLERAKVRLQEAKLAARLSPDLTKADRKRVIKALDDEFNEVSGAPQGAIGRGMPSLGELVQQTMSVEEALVMGEPSWEEIYATPS
jgi:hypothetical protein